MTDPRSAHEARWPAERFYWALLDAPGVGARRPRSALAERLLGRSAAALDALLADEVPAPLDELHAVYLRVDARRVLACAAPRAALEGVDALSLTPDAVPAWAPPVDPARLNLLVGAHEPRALRTQRARRSTLVVVAGALALLLVAWGLARRAGALEGLAADARGARAAALGLAPGASGPDLDDAQRALAARVQRERWLRDPRVQGLAPRDAASALGDLLALWPRGVRVHAESVVAGPELVTIVAASEQDPRALLDALAAPPGWTLRQPRLSRAGGVARVTVALDRAREGRP